MTTTKPSSPAAPEIEDIAGQLRQSVFRLARLLRQQDDSGIAPALLAALATIERDGPITLGKLAEHEQLSAPSITRAVAHLETRRLAERVPDATDRRVCRVQITAYGRRRLAASRTRKTAWLTARLQELAADDVARLAGALDVIDQLVARPLRGEAG